MSAYDVFSSPEAFSARLQELRATRRDKKLLLQKLNPKRTHLIERDRKTILEKTDRRCHICGGEIDGPWEADHVFSHSLGGNSAVSNYLPAHPICNNYRWFYGTEEFQWILKLGVWLRTRIELKEPIGVEAARQFIRQEHQRHKRRIAKQEQMSITARRTTSSA